MTGKEKFLLFMLAGIFTTQIIVFSFGMFYCSRHGGIESCPRIGQRYEQTFNVMVATTLALLTGTALSNRGE